MIWNKKSNIIGSFLTLMLFSCCGIIILSSCSEDKSDEPIIENPGQDENENNDSEDQNKEDPDNNESEEFTLPDGFPETFSNGFVRLPEGTTEQCKEYTGFVVSFNKENHTPNYVAWELLSEETYGNAKREDYTFWQDPYLDGCPTKDYAYSTYGYERGHMCPAADQKWSEAAMRDSFVMANMCPQSPDLNGKAWEKLEEKERSWAKRDKAIWIIAGPIYYDTDDLRIGYSQVRVPSAFFKAFLYIHTVDPRAIAFVYPNMISPGNMEDYAMTIDELEKETGYDFFSFLPDEIEEKIESEFTYSEWNK